MAESLAVAATVKPKRALWTLDEKIGLCIECERVVKAEKRLSMYKFCDEIEEREGRPLQPSQMRRWMKNLGAMRAALLTTKKKKTKVSANPGRKSRLDKIKEQLLTFVDDMQAEGNGVSVRLLAVRAKRLDRSLRRLNRYTLFASVRRFLKSNQRTIRAVTHKSQEDPREKVEIATAFLQTTRQLITQPNRHKAFIINMDQTPYNLRDSPNKTIAKVGAKTVIAKEVKTSVGRVTTCLTVCADGTKLPPLVIFKGAPGKTVEKENKDYPKDAFYTVQENAWTDERVMVTW